ncbi:MAG: glycosyltransferase family 39 protein, partial [Acidimicrobiales bacterium]
MTDGGPEVPSAAVRLWGWLPDEARRGLHRRPRPRRSVKRWWAFWLSPDDQPRWARPVLLLVAALAALSYAWGIDNVALEPFYGAAARSMSMSWRNFFFGAFDPMGTITVDKLPGALWLQALSVRAFGADTWAFVMPQVVEGILTVLVLYRAVRRLAGAEAAMVAAVVLAASPVTVLLNRGNVSDSLLILLLVLAADATSAALTTGRLRTLVVAGVWVGLAFQAKMTQAWLVLPALWLAYLIASPARGRRLGHVVVATAVTAVVSIGWMLVVTVVPAHDRPFVDGSRDNSVFSQVFDYNGIARFQHPGAFETSVGPLAPSIVAGIESGNYLNGSTVDIGRGWHRLLW